MPASFAWKQISHFLDDDTETELGLMVLPRAAKYMQTVGFVLGELFRRFSEFLSRPQTCLLISGYGFGDEHINRLLRSALLNPTLQLVIYFPGFTGDVAAAVLPAALRKLLSLRNPRVTVVGGGAVTTIGGAGEGHFKIPYYALGRFGLHRLLIPSEKTQRPALSFALEHLNRVQWFPQQKGAGLAADNQPFLFDDCRQAGAQQAEQRIQMLRGGQAQAVNAWPAMAALAALVAESHSLQPFVRGGQQGVERSPFNYSNVSPLVTRIHRFAEDPMFRDVVNVHGGLGARAPLSWMAESTHLVEQIFGGAEVPWRVHIINLRRVSHDLTPFVLGSLLELYAYELFRRGQEHKIPTLLVLEEAHHYLRPIGSGEEANENSLAYERLAKEGRKFGLALWLSTQRPSEISPTVLSQCNNWVSFRLTSERDLGAIQAASEWADRREVRRIAGLPRQTAIIFGGSVAMPTMVRAPNASPKPSSDDAAFGAWAVPPNGAEAL